MCSGVHHMWIISRSYTEPDVQNTLFTLLYHITLGSASRNSAYKKVLIRAIFLVNSNHTLVWYGPHFYLQAGEHYVIVQLHWEKSVAKIMATLGSHFEKNGATLEGGAIFQGSSVMDKQNLSKWRHFGSLIFFQCGLNHMQQEILELQNWILLSVTVLSLMMTWSW